MNTYKSIKKVMLVGITATALLSGCGNDTKEEAKKDTKQEAQQADKAKEEARAKEEAKKEEVKGQSNEQSAKGDVNEIGTDLPHSTIVNLLTMGAGNQTKAVYSDEGKRIKVGMDYDTVTDILGTVPNIAEGEGRGAVAIYKGYYSNLLLVTFGEDGKVISVKDEGIQSKEEVEAEKINDKKYEKKREEEAEKLQESYKKSEQEQVKNDRMPWYKDVNNDSASVDYSHYEKIKVGMSANQVKEAIGKPRMIEKYKSYSVYGYLGDREEGTLRVIFDPNGTVTRVEQDNLPKYERMHGNYDDTLPNGGRDID
ncbi:hypothetical protein CN445_21795 [Bacillus cereus]|nr:hypothetical protein CN445_21795 [Bacillus cereus]